MFSFLYAIHFAPPISPLSLNMRLPYSTEGGSIGEYLVYLYRSLSPTAKMPTWPPDVFGIAASILQRSSSYPRALTGRWPPQGTLSEWRSRVESCADKWRKAWNDNGKKCSPPAQVQRHWRTLLEAWNSGIDCVPEEARLALLNLMAISDETCLFAGFPPPGEGSRRPLARNTLLALSDTKWATLCQGIHASKVAVLPKSHTPQTGFT